MRRKTFLVLFVFMLAGRASAQTATPTPTPAVTIVLTVPRSDMYGSMATAAANVNRLPDEIRAPGGQSIVPSANLAQLFAWAKWLFSLNTAQELLGKTLGPIGIELYAIFQIVVILTSIYYVINIIVLIIKAVIWVINQILKIIPFF